MVEDVTLAESMARTGLNHRDLFAMVRHSNERLLSSEQFQFVVLSALARIEDRLSALERRVTGAK